ncbi:TPA: anti sigma factor C-terminal domain-containing protein [Bacillus tropicus]|uniref:anti-sigma factor n=1 Tax=Bacillus cereus group TaxID=86661 RepID=UPI00003CBC47|nr:anti sigma factor C-terminal domain-containing protein [Bacillus tropicus]AIY77590.1 zinc-finger family protein [Bacillus cereus]AJI05185.1 zinc-finger family protein [Bacillus cereus G9241]PET35186.1 sigma-M negative effector [Bacillus anthracis]ARO17050.1 sigma-M negative effector [Bacillus cereus]EAL14108.1 sigma-M negative effector [Bacillus cereus G9241]
MGCAAFKKLWEKYENGTLTHDEQEQLESHIETCEECETHLDELLAKTEPVKKKLPPKDFKVPFWRIKWKHRLQTLGFILSICIVIYIIGGILSSFYFQSNNDKRLEEIRSVPSLALEATMPNSRVMGGGTSVEAFFRTNSHFDVVKTVGKKEIPLGTLETSSFLSSVNVLNNSWMNTFYQPKLFFVHPKTEQGDYLKESSKKVWDTLAKVHEGTVAEIAISFDKAYTLKELEPLLYNVFEAQELPPTPLWYALDTGQEKTNVEDHILHGGEAIGFPEHIRFLDSDTENQKTPEDKVIEMMRILSTHTETVSKIAIIPEKELKLDKRYQYVKDNGVKVYGMVITGPSKELLKLQNSPHVRYATLGDIEVWNWFDY